MEVKVGEVAVRPFQSMDDAVSFVINGGDVRAGAAIAINPEKVVLARSDAELRTQIEAATLRYADGIGVVKALRKKGAVNARIPGCELWEALMLKSVDYQLPVMLIGASPEVCAATQAKLADKGVNVVSAIHGYTEGTTAIERDLLAHQPKIVSVAMGSPRQEKLIGKLRQIYPDAFYMGVGGTYDVFTGRVRRAPAFFCRLHMEWLYRLMSQPSRIFRQRALAHFLALYWLGRL